MKVCLIGSEGNMGSRYSKILQKFRVDFVGVDKKLGTFFTDEFFNTREITHIIIATPTEEHISNLGEILTFNPYKPYKILCEKPLFNSEDYRENVIDITYCLPILLEHLEAGNKIFMVNNYAYFPIDESNEFKDTFYSSSKHGKDGLDWDCIQLIHLAKGKIELSEADPWTAMINGTLLEKSFVKESYKDMIADFLFDTEGKLWGVPEIISAHLKVMNYRREKMRGLNAK